MAEHDLESLRWLSTHRPSCLADEMFCDRMVDAGLMSRGGYPDAPVWLLTAAGRSRLDARSTPSGEG